MRNWLASLFETFNVEGNGLSDVGERFVTGGALRNATGKGGNLGDENPIFIYFYQDSALHLASPVILIHR